MFIYLACGFDSTCIGVTVHIQECNKSMGVRLHMEGCNVTHRGC